MRKDLSRQGFSIFEVLIVMALFALVLFAVAGLKGNLDSLQNIISQRLQSRQDLEQTLQIFVTELRSAGPSSLGEYPIAAAASSSLTFYSDIDKDGLFERVHYYLSSTTLRKGVIKPTGNPLVYATSSEIVNTIVNYVVPQASTSVFSYYGTDYTGTQTQLASSTDVSQIRLVKISLYADVNPLTAPLPVFFADTVDIRNLRSN